MLVDEPKIISIGRSALEIEARAILSLVTRIGSEFIEACKIILNCQGRVVVMGMGKSGHIARKISATLASTGTPTLFVHPAEASHGDLGMLTQKDVMLMLSNSGETDEIISILPLIKRLGLPMIVLTGNAQSTLAKLATVHLDVSVDQEACPLGLAPTASTTAALAMGDALASSILEARGFTAEDFAKSHPAGRLGKRLLIKVEDIMHTSDAIPRVAAQMLLAEGLMEMTKKRLGFTTVVSDSDQDELLGIFTDGDLRRAFGKGVNIHQTFMKDIMVAKCTSVPANMLASEAIPIMQKIQSFVLPVLSQKGKLVGALHMHDLLRAGVL